jgi:hypothetical protein
MAAAFGEHLRRASAVTGRTESSFDTINLVRTRRLWDPVAGSCYSVPAPANKSWSRYRRPKIERSCIGAYPERNVRLRPKADIWLCFLPVPYVTGGGCPKYASF